MLGSVQFQIIYVNGMWTDISDLIFPDTLDLSAGDPDVGEIPRGKAMKIADHAAGELGYADAANFFGFLVHDVDEKGTTTGTGRLEFIDGYRDIPIKRGLPVTVRQLPPGSIIEVETPADSDYDNLSDKTTIAAAADETLLTFDALGNWAVATTGDFVFGKKLDSVTPQVALSERTRILLTNAQVMPA